MRLYRCAWPNGSISIVLAHNKEEAVFLLDEWGSAEAAWLTSLDTFMIDFEPDRARAELTPPADDDTDNFDLFHKFILNDLTVEAVAFPDRRELADLRKKSDEKHAEWRAKQAAAESSSMVGRK